jgi:hypothetical protein
MTSVKTPINSDWKVTEEDPELAILQVLADYKWADGFVCRKCGHDHYCAGKKPYSRRCTKCKTEESATAHTVFHRCRIPLTEAVKLAETVCKQPDISTYEISRIFDKRQMTCWKFKTRIMECLTDEHKASLLKHLIVATR